MPEESPYFFLSYAHTPEQALVLRLYRDLSKEIWERTAWPNDLPPGFVDKRDIATGVDWRTAVAGAIGTCRVLVPLYSRKYFSRPECGKEFHAFDRRIVEHRALRGGHAAPIVPALWAPLGDEEVPEAARYLQADFNAVHPAYSELGLYTLVKNSRFRSTYLQVVSHLAVHIIEYAERNPMRPAMPHEVDLGNDAFRPAGQAGAGPVNRLTIMVAAPTPDRLPEARSAAFYGADPSGWTPYLPGNPKPAVEIAATISRALDYEPRVVPLEEGLDPQFWSADDSEIGVVLLDPWVCLHPAYAEQIRRIDSLGGGRVGVIVVWNPADPQSLDRADGLRAALAALAPQLLGDPGTPDALGARHARSAGEFAESLTAVLNRAMTRRLNDLSLKSDPDDEDPFPRLGRP